MQSFFNQKLEANKNEPLTEDLELPPKQRPTAARPRLPASGKIAPPSGLGGVGAGGPTNSPSKRSAPATTAAGSSSSFAAKLASGTEPNKKKIKKNSGLAMGVPDDEAANSTTTTGVDGVKGSAAAKATDNDANGEDDPAVGGSSTMDLGSSVSKTNGVDMSDGIDGSFEESHHKSEDNAAPLTNGTVAAGEVS